MKKIIALVCGILLAAATPAFALQDSWNMVASMDEIPESGGSNRDMTLNASGSGEYAVFANFVTWLEAPAWGVVQNSSNKNPDSSLAALGARVTVTSIGGSGYSGNVIQKGLFSDGGQIKLQIVDDDGGSFACRFEGTSGSLLFVNDQVTDIVDGTQHVAFCVRNGDTLKTVVDGVEEVRTLDVGSISNDKNLTTGNKGASGDETDQHFGRNVCSAYAYGAGAVAYVEGELESNC